MSWSSRRAISVLSLAAVLAGMSAIGHVSAQKAVRPRPPVLVPGGAPGPAPGTPGAPGVPKKDGYDLGSLTLPKDDDLKERIEAAADRIKVKDWDKACDTLQALLGRHEDIFVPVTRISGDGAEITAYVSVKKEAARLIASLPKAGRDVYEAKFGGKAGDMVKRARINNNFREMAQALSLYLYSEAGVDAATWLGTHMLNRADFQGATRFFLQLIERSGIQGVKDRSLLKAAIAFHQAGDFKSRDLAFKELERRGIEIKLREETTNVAGLQAAVNKLVARVSLQSASDSPIYRGRPDRSAMLPAGTPFLEPDWRSLKMTRTEASAEQIKRAETMLQTKNQPILSSFIPVTATMRRGDRSVPLVIYRNYQGIQALELKSGKVAWDAKSEWSLDEVLGATGRERDSQKISAYTTWLGHYLASTARPEVLFENSVLNTLSADNRMVYAVEDMPLPPPQNMVLFDPRLGGGGYNWGTEVTAAINHNRLQAYDLNKDGKLAWEAGGKDVKGPLEDTYFLGPPLPLNDRLYVLTEKQRETHLATIEPGTGKLIGLQALASTKDLKLSQDPMRRIQACHVAYGEGILVIPTNAGAIFGVDLLSNSLLWAYPYRPKDAAPATAPQPGNPNMGGRFGVVPPGFVRLPDGRVVKPSSDSHWIVTAPAVQDGKVVFTAPDAPDIHCVNLHDGSRVWSHPPRPGDLFFAGVYNGKAIIVGKSRTRAISLNKGEVLWELETGLPSGQGAAGAPNIAGDIIYYLPIREAVNTRDPEVCAINVDRGIIHAHTRSRKKEVAGNLLFYEGTVLSQTHAEVVAYPQLEIKLAEMDRKVKENDKDAVALTERGDYLLDKGDLAGAIADFRKALQNGPAKETLVKARAKLYEAFTEHFQRDFNKAEEYIKEYEEICKIDMSDATGPARTTLEQEQRRRRANFLCLVGKGRESQNRLVEAFEKYLELANEAQKDELIQVVDEPSVKAAPDVWSQGRIAAMVAGSSDAKQKKQLEDLIRKRWATIRTSKSTPLEDLRKFVALFGSLFDVGKEARLALAERLMDDTDISSLLEAEQQLCLLRADSEKPEIAARAVEALARLNTRKGMLEDAAYYYRQLGEKFPRVTVDGKTGAEYLEDLATDKRFLPYLDQAGRFVIKDGQKVELRASEDKSGHAAVLQYQFGQSGEPLPFFSRYKLSLGQDWNHQLRIVDITTNETKPPLPLTRTQFQQIAQANNMGHKVKFNFQNLGHLVVLQLGHMVYGIDPLHKPRVLWERNLSSLPGSAAAAPSYQSLQIDGRDNSVVLLYPDGWMQRLGETGPLQGGVVCLLKRDSLEAIDPVSGRTLWTRMDVNSRSQVFGDDEHVYVVSLDDNLKASGTRVFRAYDGVTVRVRDFSNVFNSRLRVHGRTILVSETDAKNQLTLRLYDVLQGKDVWTQKYPQGTIQLSSEDEHLAGVVEPNGTVKVYDVVQGKEVLNSKLADPAHIDKAQSIHLVSDPDYMVVAINGPADPNVPPWNGGLMPNVVTGSGLRSVPVNGNVYLFDRKTGKYRWYNFVDNQHLVVSQLEDMPMLLFTARYQYLTPPPARMAMMKSTARAIAKHNGKLWYDNPNVPMVNNNPHFHTLTMDHRTGKVDFTGAQLKLTMTTEPR